MLVVALHVDIFVFQSRVMTERKWCENWQIVSHKNKMTESNHRNNESVAEGNKAKEGQHWNIDQQTVKLRKGGY